MPDYQFDLSSPSEIREQLSAAVDQWRYRNDLIRATQEILTGKNSIKAPQSAQYNIATAHSFYLLASVNEKAARFLDRPRIAVVANGVSQSARDHATKVEHWVNEAFSQLDKNSGSSVWGAVTRDALCFDLGVERIERAPAAFWPEIAVLDEEGKSKLMRVYEDAKEFEKAKDAYLKRAGLPIRSVYVSPESYLPIYEGPTPVQEFQVEQRSLRSVMRNKLFNTDQLATYPKGRDGGIKTQVTILHVVNSTHHAYYALAPSTRTYDGTSWPRADSPDMMSIGEPVLLYAYEHGLGRSIYNVVAGRFSGYRNQQDWVEGAVLQALIDLNQDMDELLSQAFTVHRATSWKTPVAYYDPELRGADGGMPKPPQIQEGEPIAMWTTERLGSFYEVTQNPMFESLWDKFSGRISELSGSSVLYGDRAPGVETGYHQELQISQAEHLDEKIEEHFAAGAVNRAELIIEHSKKLGEKVYVTPIEKDTRGRYFGTPIALSANDVPVMPTMAAKVRGTSPLNVVANLRAVLDATMVRPGHERPLYDDQTALEQFMGEEAPEEIGAKIDIQNEKKKLLDSGILTQHISRKVNMMLVQEGTPTVTPEMAANADPALLQTLGGMNAQGAPTTAGGIDPRILEALTAGQQMAGVPSAGPTSGLGVMSPFNGRGGGTPIGTPQPENQVGLAASRQGAVI